MLQNEHPIPAASPVHAMRVRAAQHRDIEQLLSLDSAVPNTTRLDATVLHRLVDDENTDLFVAEKDGTLHGYSIVLYRPGYHSARLYSILVAPQAKPELTIGVARELLNSSEETARRRGMVTMRLEVSLENQTAIKLYERAGYEHRGQTSDQYYGDQREYVRMRKRFVTENAAILPVPYYAQHFSFTSGPASLLMAMRYHTYPLELNRELELAVWREATGAFNLSGHGGCSAHGLAVAALRRGFSASVVASSPDVPFIEGARDDERRAVIRVAHETFEDELRSQGGSAALRSYTDSDITSAIDHGAIPIVLLAGHRSGGKRGAHWVVITGYDSQYVYVNDPYTPEGADPAESVHLALPRKNLMQLSRYGKHGNRFMLIVSRWGDVHIREEPLETSGSYDYNL